MNLVEIAEANHRNGYSCSQSVFAALAKRWNMDPELALRVAAGLGGGIARSARTCGCVTGAIMAIGLAQRSVAPEVNQSEKESMEVTLACPVSFSSFPIPDQVPDPRQPI
jgi:C_GCAxxG_C_C family probable redox protein